MEWLQIVGIILALLVGAYNTYKGLTNDDAVPVPPVSSEFESEGAGDEASSDS